MVDAARNDRVSDRSAMPEAPDMSLCSRDRREMLDVMFISGGIAFFVVSILYTLLCEDL